MPQLFAMIESYKNTVTNNGTHTSSLQPSFCYMLGQEKLHHNPSRYMNETTNTVTKCIPVSYAQYQSNKIYSDYSDY